MYDLSYYHFLVARNIAKRAGVEHAVTVLELDIGSILLQTGRYTKARAAIKKGLAVCAGDPFYEYERNVPHLRLNFSNGSDEVIDRGIHILGDVMHELLAR